MWIEGRVEKERERRWREGRVGRGTDKITRMRQEERMREKRVQEQENLKEVMKVEEDRDTVGGNEARMNRERGRW